MTASTVAFWLAALATVIIVLLRSDLAQRKLPNRTVAVFTALVVTALVAGEVGVVAAGPWAVAVMTGVGLVVLGLALWLLGLLGGGDVKLLFGVGALVAWLGSNGLLVYLGLLIVAAGVTLGWWARTGEGERSGGIPLAPTLLVGVIPAVLGLILFGR